MNDDSLTINDVIKLCSRVKLKDGTLIFDSYGSSDTRSGTQLFLDSNELLLEDAEQIINNLKLRDFVKGPLPNDKPDRPPIWVFKANHKLIYIYIKLMVFHKRRKIAVISFHDWNDKK